MLVYLPALGDSSSGTHPDESYYLGMSAEMDAHGAWLTPTIDGRPCWFKPPLLYWAERIAYRALGRGFLGGRLPVALCAIALVVLTGALARRLHGPDSEVPAALLVATMFGLAKFGRMAMMDVPMALAFAAAAYGAWRAAEEDHPPSLLWAGVGAGTSFMLKGPVGAVIVLLLAGGFLLVRRPRLLLSRWTAGAFAIGAAIGLPWYVASLLVHGRAFYQFFIVEQNLGRFTEPWTLSGEETLLVGFAVLLLPWTLLVAAQAPALRRVRQDPALLLCAAWIGAVLLVFTVPSLKWPHYGLMCAPAAALLAARAPPPRWARIATAAVLAAFAAAALLPLRWPLPAAAGTALVGAAAALAGGALLVARSRVAGAALAVAGALALLLGVTLPEVNPPVIPPKALAALAGRDLYVYGYVPGIFTLGAGRPVHRVERGPEMERALASGGVVILDARGLRALDEPTRSQVVPVTRWQHIPGYLPASTVLRAWRERDPALLFEPMLAVERARGDPGAFMAPPASRDPRCGVRTPPTRSGGTGSTRSCGSGGRRGAAPGCASS
jgi:4-amino-4-deoxy-L-arabinose transferase-like glycosyltransferase